MALFTHAQIDSARAAICFHHGIDRVLPSVANNRTVGETIRARYHFKPDTGAEHLASVGADVLLCIFPVFFVDSFLFHLPLLRAIQYFAEI